MNIFDLIVVQPIFNLLVLIYGLLPGSDFGIALIIFTIVVRLLMWPLIKKQLHQTKVQRAIQPELKKIRKQANGNKQLEGQMMLELYRERGINPMSSIGILLLQLPIFIALFSVINIITKHRDQIAKFTYDFIENLGPIHDIIHSSTHYFNESLLGLINLSKTAIENGQIYWPLMIMAVLSAVLQYYQSKQISPQPTEHKRLRDVMKVAAEGKEVDQAEVSAIMSQRMLLFFPILTFMVMIYLPGAITLYVVVSSIVAIIQQKIILSRDLDEMEVLASSPARKDNDVKVKKSGGVTTKTRIISDTKQRAEVAKEAEIVSVSSRKPRGKKRSKRR